MSSSTPLKSAIPSSQALAVKRTQLANTRTLLAYVRTALGCAGFAVAVEKLYPGEQGALPAAFMAIIAVGIMVYGAASFLQDRRYILGKSA